MPRIIDSKTGEVSFSIKNGFCRSASSLDVGDMIIRHKGFKYNPETMALEIVDTDKEDRQAYIDSFADECGVMNVLKKYALTGDASLLNQRELSYGDISDLPVDELNPEALQQRADATLAALNAKLGTQLTAEQLQSMSQDELLALMIKASTPAAEEPKESEGE